MMSAQHLGEGTEIYTMKPIFGVDVYDTTVVLVTDQIVKGFEHDGFTENEELLTKISVLQGPEMRAIRVIEYKNVNAMVGTARQCHVNLINYMISSMPPKYANVEVYPGMTLTHLRNQAWGQLDDLPFAVAKATDCPIEMKSNQGKTWIDISIFLAYMSNIVYEIHKEMADLCFCYMVVNKMSHMSPMMAKIYSGFKRVLGDFHDYISILCLNGSSLKQFRENDPYQISMN